MLEEALPIAVGVGAALLPALAFGGVAAARAFIYLGAGEDNSTINSSSSLEVSVAATDRRSIGQPFKSMSRQQTSCRVILSKQALQAAHQLHAVPNAE
jgi:hypothetical protein